MSEPRTDYETMRESATPPTAAELAEWRRKTEAFAAIGPRDDYDRKTFIEMAEPAMPRLIAEVERLRADAALGAMVRRMASIGAWLQLTHDPNDDTWALLYAGLAKNGIRSWRDTPDEALYVAFSDSQEVTR